MADKLVLGMTSAGVMEYIELSNEYGITELMVPKKFLGKSIHSLQLRSRYGLNVIALRREDQIQIPPDIEMPLDDSVTLVLLGSYADINRLQKE